MDVNDAELFRASDGENPEADAAADARLGALLAACVESGASDLHLAPGRPPYFRVHGDLCPDAAAAALTQDEVARMAWLLCRGSGAVGLATTGSQDGAFTRGGGRFRFNVFRRQGGVSIAVRLLEETFRTLGELGLPESLYALCDLPDGIVLVAGPTGAGKSTTLAALVDRVNRSRRTHIITIEDPVEYVHEPVQSLINQRQVGADAASFHDALVASLREDPDVILVGEVRDLDTIRTAIRAAETGHLVLTTVHAGDSVGTIERLVSVFPADEQAGIRQQLALVLRAIVAQHLLPADGPASIRSGRRGRVVASEVLMCTPAIAHLVGTGKSAQVYAAMEGGGRLGMQTLEQDLARLLVSGQVTEVTATSVSRSPALVRDRAEVLDRSASGVRTVR